MNPLDLFARPEPWVILITLIALPYIGLPILIKNSQRFRRNFSLQQFDPTRQPPPAQVAQFFERVEAELKQIGFAPACYCLIHDLLPNVTGIVAAFNNDEQQDAAAAVFMFGFQDESRQSILSQEQYVEFSTEYQNGSEVSTNNSHQESAFPPVEHRHRTQLPRCGDLASLYRVHKHQIASFGHPPKRMLPPPGTWREELRKSMLREFDEQLNTGFLEMDDQNENYVPTWKGAYLMTWRQMWPLSNLRMARRRARARKLLLESGNPADSI